MPHQKPIRRRTWSIEAETLPQDPFLPQQLPISGPSFLDTGACLCQLRAGPGPELAWRCIGNQTQALVQEKSGKWFKTEFAKAETDRLLRPLNDDSSPPITTKFFRHTGNATGLVEGGEDLDVWDRACTGENRTSFSTSWYRAVAQIDGGEYPVDAVPCWRPNTIPVQIQSVDDWMENGCSPGFLCKS